jgi:bacterioferritin
MLKKAIAHEIQASIQYKWQQLSLRGIEGAAAENIFKHNALESAKSAEALAERLVYLAGVLPETFDAIHIEYGLDDMLKLNIQNSEETIDLLKQTIQQASKDGDYGTRRIVEDVLVVEERHLDRVSKLLVGMTKPFTQLKLDSE